MNNENIEQEEVSLKQQIINFVKKHKVYINYFIALLIGFLFAYFANYNSKTKQVLAFIYKDKCYHIHHWITYGVIILFVLLSKYLATKYINHIISIKLDNLILFFLGGLILEDFLYRDIFQIREKCKSVFYKTPSMHKTLF